MGTLGPLHVRLHLKVDSSGLVTGTLDSPDQGANGISCADFRLDGEAMSFTVPAVHGSWKGTVANDGASLSGTWDQGSPTPLNFARDNFVAAAKPSPVDGIWLGTLQVGSTPLRLQLSVKSDTAGREFCAMDSLDQHAMGLECAKVVLSANDFSFDVPAVHGNWKGTLSADGNILSGVWSQGSPLPLNFTRRSVAIAAAPIAAPTYDAALAPVAAADLQSVLDRDLAEALKSGELAPGTGVGISIAVVEHGVRRVFSYGAAKQDSIFEIGSITKTFTGLVLSQMVEQGKVKFDEPVRELLPPGTVAKPAGNEITLLDLATQHSGLPRIPDNFKPADPSNPYADYGAPNLYAFVAQHGVAKPVDAGFLYSNLGFGLLGQALSVHSGLSYPALLKKEVIDPLGLKDTTVSLSPAQQIRFVEGHDEHHHPAHAWDLDALAGAGAIRSTAADMLTYLEANLHPEKLTRVAGSSAGATLSAALVQSHQLRADAMPGTRIALAWLFVDKTGDYWHNGATGGYSSYAFFNPKADYAAVVLLNTTLGSTGSFADRLGEHISQRLAGKPAISLAN
ncbi:serine hydrolase domain-containing protein [Acidisarcina polymorpha]|uniref:serine hydrolase domain-containing protein n=1 Tax=Acidisarcina polymorpha TaxID=2211140 RepID=UPI0013749A58|nr:serine hydrolase domain-containing protein [Acidisarcina polymorpha]